MKRDDPFLILTDNKKGRNVSASLNGSTVGSYTYNAFEQRVQKVAGGVTTQFVFDRFGHLLEEANGSGTVQKEYIWLDDLPVAMVDVTTNTIYFVHTDQLGTPQKITDGSANVVWDGVYDPFGLAVSVSSLWGSPTQWGSFTWEPTTSVPTNLRFPGQYADAETALNQNWFRDYDPSIGRYTQSDPIGLWGRINTYNYASENPVERFDPTGLFDPRPLTTAERIALGEEVAGGGPEDPFADLGAALTLGIGLAIAVSSPDIARIPDGGGLVTTNHRAMEALVGVTLARAFVTYSQNIAKNSPTTCRIRTALTTKGSSEKVVINK